MSESLRDQLLKSGLARNLKAGAPAPGAKKPRKDSGPRADSGNRQTSPRHQQHSRPQQLSQHETFKPAKESSALEPNLAHAYALRAKQEKDEREAAQREIERVANEKRERKRKLASLLGDKSLNASEADVPRHFPHGNKIRRLYCTAVQLVELNRGNLAVVQFAGRYLLVSKDVAKQAQGIDEQALVLLCDQDAPPDDDVPADLIW